jgi:hypothetical protein
LASVPAQRAVAKRYASAVSHGDVQAALAISRKSHWDEARFDIGTLRELHVHAVAWMTDCVDNSLGPLQKGPCFGFQLQGKLTPADILANHLGTLSVVVDPTIPPRVIDSDFAIGARGY